MSHRGACHEFCGGFAGLVCDTGEVCDLPPGLCSGADLAGICVPAPDGCDDVWEPVCGCDGQQYGNPCTAASAGVSVDHAGPC